MGQAKDRQNRREAKKAKRKLNHKAHVKAKNVEKNSSGKEKGSNAQHRNAMKAESAGATKNKSFRGGRTGKKGHANFSDIMLSPKYSGLSPAPPEAE